VVIQQHGHSSSQNNLEDYGEQHLNSSL